MKKLVCLFLCAVLAFLPTVSSAAMRVGNKGENVRLLQQRLINLGILESKADGDYGQKTQHAVKEAQRLLILAGQPLEATGTADDATLACLFDESMEPALRTLCLGSSGSRVSEAQNRLMDLNLLDPPVDGAFGTTTEEAVRQFQLKLTELGAPVSRTDGVLDVPTQQLLFGDLAAWHYPAPVCFDESEPLQLTGEYLFSDACILMNATSGEVLFEHNSRRQMYPASTTKILTLLVALEMSDLSQTVTIPKAAAQVPEDSSLMPVSPGEKMTMESLLHGLMIRSGNDAANAVAALCCGDVDTFVDKMNEKAQQLGAYDSHFANPHGYQDENHYTTAYDLALLTRNGLTDPVFCRIVTALSYAMPETAMREARELKCTHEIFNPESEYYIPYAAGVKSGYTSAAGFCYVGAAQTKQGTLIAVVLHAPTRNRAWVDLRRLFAYGYATME
ncbi:MAG: peptidoglycan-binding protein [Clostridia bacterium]|nr:peptidoglycan-binding protein [Clostridia bacterium]